MCLFFWLAKKKKVCASDTYEERHTQCVSVLNGSPKVCRFFWLAKKKKKHKVCASDTYKERHTECVSFLNGSPKCVFFLNDYGVATISRLPEIIGLFCRIQSLL